MNLNGLLHNHQVALMMACSASDDLDRQRHLATAAFFAERLRKLRGHRLEDGQVTSYSEDSIDSGNYAGPVPDGQGADYLSSWEDEGGSLSKVPPGQSGPEISTVIAFEYHVGPYVYQDASLALAELERQKQHAGGRPLP